MLNYVEMTKPTRKGVVFGCIHSSFGTIDRWRTPYMLLGRCTTPFSQVDTKHVRNQQPNRNAHVLAQFPLWILWLVCLLHSQTNQFIVARRT